MCAHVQVHSNNQLTKQTTNERSKIGGLLRSENTELIAVIDSRVRAV